MLLIRLDDQNALVVLIKNQTYKNTAPVFISNLYCTYLFIYLFKINWLQWHYGWQNFKYAWSLDIRIIQAPRKPCSTSYVSDGSHATRPFKRRFDSAMWCWLKLVLYCIIMFRVTLTLCTRGISTRVSKQKCIHGHVIMLSVALINSTLS